MSTQDIANKTNPKPSRSETPGDNQEGLTDRARAQLDIGRETAREATEKIGEKFQETRAQVEKQIGGAVEQVNETMTSATRQGQDFVRNNPGLALAGALGLGVLIGLALRERR